MAKDKQRVERERLWVRSFDVLCADDPLLVMKMTRQPLSGSKLRSAAYDDKQQRLEIEFADRSVRRYKSVPAEVWRRLLAAPNPFSYFEDRIADEYPSEPASAEVSANARSRLDDLFK